MASFKNLLAAVVTLAAVTLLPSVFDFLAKAAAVILVFHLYEFTRTILRNYIFNKTLSPSKKAVLITGCDSGFGHFLAEKLDLMGYRVFAGCLIPSGKGAKDLQEKTSTRLHVVDLDVTDNDSVLSSLNTVKKSLADGEELWAVVNNAGIAQAGELDWASVEQIQRVLDVNTMGMVRVTKAFIPLLRKSKGRIVNLTSLCGRLCLPGLAGYSMSKSAAVFFTTGLRMELRKWGIKAISIEPFFYHTPMTSGDSCLKIIQKTWDELPGEEKNLYGANYLTAMKKASTDVLNRSSHKIDDVLDCLIDAITTKEPLPTYFPCYLPHKILLLIGRMLPSSMVESTLRSQMPRFTKPVTSEI